MKIEISDESYKFLKDFINELDSQDNRCTASPYFYEIQEKVIMPVPDSHGDSKAYIHDEGFMSEKEVLEYYGKEGQNIDDVLESNPDISEFDVVEQWQTNSNHNVFFTEKAAMKFLEQNKHRFREKNRIYLNHAFRNKELEELFKSTREIAKA